MGSSASDELKDSKEQEHTSDDDAGDCFGRKFSRGSEREVRLRAGRQRHELVDV
jgi:hypothetical protein